MFVSNFGWAFIIIPVDLNVIEYWEYEQFGDHCWFVASLFNEYVCVFMKKMFNTIAGAKCKINISFFTKWDRQCPLEMLKTVVNDVVIKPVHIIVTPKYYLLLFWK